MAKKTTKQNTIPEDKNILDVNIEDAMPDNYLPYAVEVAKDRALPDVRDGLKPVHRRILYGAYELNALPTKPYYKSARIVGDILGKYHPHGDSSVYDAMVIMAQDFSTKEPLFQGHGNFGSIDGDSAAAMRYTEARLSNIALEMLRDLHKNTVDFVPNYSDSEMEPKVLPARYPNLLVNGTFGIAVGLATNIPPHNLSETIDGTIALIDNPELTTKELMEYIKAPDLPTGGELIGYNSLLSAYETGEGKVALRAKCNIETLENGRLGIVITEFPFRKNKAKLLQTISEMTGDKKHQKALETITDIRDESDRSGIRAVIEFRKSADVTTVDTVLKYLLKKTDLQINLNFNMVALANGKPETLGLKSILTHYINHQKDVVTRRTRTELEDAEKRFHIVEGFIKAIGIMDELVAVIRASKNKQDSKVNIQNEFGFSEAQSEAIVTLMLYRLTSLEIKEYEKEYKELQKLIKKLNKILKKESALLDIIKEELLDIKNRYGSERKTTIIQDENAARIDVEEIIVDEEIVITQSNDGFIKRIPLKSYNRTSGDIADIENREDDYTKFVYNANTKDTILFFTESAQMYQMKAINVPEYKWKEKGERICEIVKAKGLDNENILLAHPIKSFNDKTDIVIITKLGGYKRFPLSQLATNYTKIASTRLKKGDSIAAIFAIPSDTPISNFEIKTDKGFHFNLKEKEKEEVLVTNQPQQYVNLLENDTVVFAQLINENIEEPFLIDDVYIKASKDKLMVSNSEDKDSTKLFMNDSILLTYSDGCVLKIPASMLNMSKEINLSNIYEGKIANVAFVDGNNAEKTALFFFSNKGNVKKILVSEFTDMNIMSGYKLKDEESIVGADIGILNESELFIFSKKGMCLRFTDNCFTNTGRNASGINGIRLKDDEVVGGMIVDYTSDVELRINGLKRITKFADIEFKNKGTIGVSIAPKITEVDIRKV